MSRVSNEKIIACISLLALICVCSFLLAKYIVWYNIDRNDIPVDTSTRL